MVCVENYSAADGYGMGGYDREVIYLFVLIVRIVPHHFSVSCSSVAGFSLLLFGGLPRCDRSERTIKKSLNSYST